MENENQEQQPNVPPTSPPSSPDLTAEVKRLQKDLESATRSYNGLDGNFKKVKSERDSFETQLKDVSEQYEGKIKTLEIERDGLKTTTTTKAQEIETLQKSHTAAIDELEVLRTVMIDFPDLAPVYAKGLIRPGGLKGEELKTFLSQWKETLGELGASLSQNHSSGTTPPSPNPNIGSMTLDEASDKKIEALRRGGPNSKEYIQFEKIEQDLIRQRKRP